ncbi:HNH endonuclease [Burkholderia sp. 3C]
MMRLSEPKYTAEQAVDKCIEGITGNNVLKAKVMLSKLSLVQGSGRYLESAEVGKLIEIVALDVRAPDDVAVIDQLTKSDLIKLYDNYFSKIKKPARDIYDSLLNSALERCPFCGGIGIPRNLDHFLPKSIFPQFSIVPGNLVPSCLDCNLGEKGEGFAQLEEEQIIHPYAENGHFFDEQWIFARYKESGDGSPGVFDYYVAPPGHWNEVDKARVAAHFVKFGLGKRFSIKAAEGLGTNLKQIERMTRHGLSDQDVCEVLLQPGIDEAPFVNHWQRGKYQALAEHVLAGELLR